MFYRYYEKITHLKCIQYTLNTLLAYNLIIEAVKRQSKKNGRRKGQEIFTKLLATVP